MILPSRLSAYQKKALEILALWDKSAKKPDPWSG